MATKLNTIPAEESDTLLTKKPAASLKFQAHMGAANASTKAKKVVGAVAAAALVLGVLAATTATAGVAPTRTNLSSKSKAQQIKLYADPSKCLTAKDGPVKVARPRRRGFLDSFSHGRPLPLPSPLPVPPCINTPTNL